MKTNLKQISLLLLSLCAFPSCGGNDDDDRDLEYPVISAQGITPSPVNGQVVERGGILSVKYVFTDNAELGAFNIEVHHDFDHHTHSTSPGEYTLDEKKDPVNPWVFNQDYSIPTGLKRYVAQLDIPVPEDIDTGDYHFMIRLTDTSGWQQLFAAEIKVK